VLTARAMPEKTEKEEEDNLGKKKEKKMWGKRNKTKHKKTKINKKTKQIKKIMWRKLRTFRVRFKILVNT